MTPDPLLLFPLTALALVVFHAARGRGGDVPGSLANRARRRQLLGHAAVITLPIGAVIAEIWPLWPAPYLGKAAQALLLFAIVMLPLVAAHVVVTRRQRGRTRVRGAVTTASDASRRLRTIIDESASAKAAESAASAGGDAAEPSTEGWSLTALRAGEEEDAPVGSASAGDERRAGHEALRAPSGRRAERTDARTPGEAVRSLVEGGARVRRSTTAPSGTREAATHPASTSTLKAVALELRGMRGREIVELVHALRTDGAHLRRLVVSRHAAYVAERRARERAHAVTRDAIGALQSARASQRLAEKVARRERRERLHAEAKYERTARALRNAVSVIKGGRHPRAGDGTRRGTVRSKVDGESGRELGASGAPRTRPAPAPRSPTVRPA